MNALASEANKLEETDVTAIVSFTCSTWAITLGATGLLAMHSCWLLQHKVRL